MVAGPLMGPLGAGCQVETKPWQIQLPSRKLEVELTTVSSNYHVEMNPSDVGNNDRYVVQEIIKVRPCRPEAAPAWGPTTEPVTEHCWPSITLADGVIVASAAAQDPL